MVKTKKSRNPIIVLCKRLFELIPDSFSLLLVALQLEAWNRAALAIMLPPSGMSTTEANWTKNVALLGGIPTIKIKGAIIKKSLCGV